MRHDTAEKLALTLLMLGALLVIAAAISSCQFGNVQAVPSVGATHFVGEENATALSVGASFYAVPEVAEPEWRTFPTPVAPTPAPAPASPYDWPAAPLQQRVPLATSQSLSAAPVDPHTDEEHERMLWELVSHLGASGGGVGAVLMFLLYQRSKKAREEG